MPRNAFATTIARAITASVHGNAIWTYSKSAIITDIPVKVPREFSPTALTFY